MCVILTSRHKYDIWIYVLRDTKKSNKEPLWLDPFWPDRENPCQPNLAVGVMIQRIECPVKWNQWELLTPERCVNPPRLKCRWISMPPVPPKKIWVNRSWCGKKRKSLRIAAPGAQAPLSPAERVTITVCFVQIQYISRCFLEYFYFQE